LDVREWGNGMALNVLIFLVLGLLLWGTYRLLEAGSGWLNRREAARERRSFVAIAKRELGVDPISSRGRVSDDLLWQGRVQDTVMRVSRFEVVEDFGPESRWLVEIEDPAFDAPRAQIPAMIEALRQAAVLPDGFSLEPGKLRYAEPGKSVQGAVSRIRALLALLEPAPPSGSPPVAPPVDVSQ
jgi:hypothetical protein